MEYTEDELKYYKGMLLWVLVMLATGGVTAAGLYIFYRISFLFFL